MPFLYTQHTVAVELEELVPTFWNSYNSLKQELWRYKDKRTGIKKITTGGNGRKLLVDFDTLPEQYQNALHDPRKVDNPLALFYKLDPDAVRYYSNFKRAGNALKPDEQFRYVINASVMNALIALEKERISQRLRMRGSTRGIIDTLIFDAESFNDFLNKKYQYTHTLPTSKRFKEAFKSYKIHSYYSLIKDPNGVAKQNARKVDDRVEMVFNALFTNQSHKPTPTEVARNYDAFLNGYADVFNEDTGELLKPSEFPTVSTATIINYINKWENRIGTHLSRSGDRQLYMGQYKPPHQMELPTMSGSILSIDDRQPPFVYNTSRDRAWFYLGVDIASQAFTVFVYGKSKEGIITDFYRQMLRNYTEWGINLPYELECESSLNSSFKKTFLQPGVMFDEVKIEANNARGKYIERMNGELRYTVEKSAPGWLARPHAKSESNQPSSGPMEIVPYDQLIHDRLTDIMNWNNSEHPKSKGKSRWQYFLENQNPNLRPTNWPALLPHLGYKTQTSCKLGYITLQNKKRAIADNSEILTGEPLIEIMKKIEGKEVDVYWIDDNEGNVLKALVYVNDRLICETMEMPTYNRAKAERTGDQMAAQILQSSYVATVEAFARRVKNGIENINIIDRTPQTISTDFVIPGMKKYTHTEKPVEILEDLDLESDFVFPQLDQSSGGGWRANL